MATARRFYRGDQYTHNSSRPMFVDQMNDGSSKILENKFHGEVKYGSLVHVMEAQ